MANTFQMLGLRLNYINQDLKVTAENTENLSTPGYKEKELPKFSESLSKSSLPLWRTNASHLSASRGGGGDSFKARLSSEQEVNFSGNNVNLRTQLIRANQSGLDHMQMTNLYRTSAEIVEMALLNTK